MKKAMHERKSGTLKSGKSGKTVNSRKQAIAIGLSQARREGVKVPAAPKKKSARQKARSKSKTSGTKRAPGKKNAGSRKSTTKSARWEG
jgi:hypothetical protein